MTVENQPSIRCYEREVNQYPAGPGVAPFDLARADAIVLQRTFERTPDSVQRMAVGDPNTIAAVGAALGRGQDNVVRTYAPSKYGPQKFAGINVGQQSDGRHTYWSRGVVHLKIERLGRYAPSGTKVFVKGADSFTLTPDDDQTALMGEILVSLDREGWAAVKFPA